MTEIFITFGLMYASEPHPSWPPAHPDGWLRVTNADDWEHAREAAVLLLGQNWAFDYDTPRDTRMYPLGEIAYLDAMTGVVTLA